MRQRESAFTLIELLVVIGIIAVLIGFLFPVLQSSLDRAKKVQAKNDLTQIVTAVNAYYTEYGRYPALDSNYDSASSASDSTDYFAAGTAENDRLLNVLRPSTTNPSDNVIAKGNPRAISFLSPAIAKDLSNPRGGIGGDGRYYDPWGSPYRIRIDNSYNNTLENPYSNGAGFDPITTGVIAWSLGKDLDGAKNAKANGDKSTGIYADDVLSWQ